MADYATAAEVKEHKPESSWGSTYDTLLGKLVTRASRAIDEEVGVRENFFLVESDSTVYLSGTGTADLPLWLDPTVGFLAAAPTSVKISEDGGVEAADYTTLASSDYFLLPWNAPSAGKPYRKLQLDVRNGDYSIWPEFPKSVEIAGKIGWSTSVPDTIKEATIIQAARWLKRGQQSFQDTGAIVELGQLRYTKELDPDVARAVKHFRWETMTV